MKSIFGFCIVLFFSLQIELSFQHAMPFPCEVSVTDPVVENVSTRIRFRITNVDNGLYVNDTNLLNYHARKMHVVIISSEWQTFQHFHPEEFGNLTKMSEEGYFYVETSFPKNGSYMMNVDFVVLTQYNYPVEGYCSFVLNVTGNTPQTPPTMVPYIADSATLKIKGLPFQSFDKYSEIITIDDLFTDSYSVDVSFMPMGTTFNQLWYCLMIQVTVTTPNGSLAVLSPFLNAQVHAVFVHNDSQRIWHTHSMNMSHSMMMSCDIDVSWEMLNYTEASQFGPTVTAYITPELPGLWQGFLQMKHENNMLLVPFQFDVYVNAPNNTSTTSGGHMGHMTMTMDGSSTTTTGGITMTTGMMDMDDNSAQKSAFSAIFMLILIFVLFE